MEVTDMNFWFRRTEIFAYFFLLFAFFISADAQTQNDSSIYQLPPGTIIRVQMENEINSESASAGDTFLTTVSAPVIVRGTIVLPIAAIIEGRVVNAKKASFGGKSGNIEVVFETLRLADGATRSIEAVLVDNPKVESSRTLNILSILGGTAAGAGLGAVSKTKNAAIIGAGIGAGAGTTFVLLRKGKDLHIKADEEFEIKLTKSVTLPVQDF